MDEFELADSMSFDEVTEEEIKQASEPEGKPFDLLTDNDLTPELMQELKALGMSKPPLVSESKWLVIEDARGIHYHIINLAALGRNFSEIALATGLNINTVRKALARPDIRAVVRAKVEEFYAGDMKKQFSSLFGKSFSAVDDILTSESAKENTKLDAAKFVIDHTIGKAQQTIVQKGSLLIDVLSKVEGLKEATNANLLDKPRDSMDDLIDEVIPATLVIGKRGDSDEGQK